MLLMLFLVQYDYKGCWRDFDISAFALPLMEGTDPKLSEPYKKRSDPVGDCSSTSQSRGYKGIFSDNLSRGLVTY